MYPGTRVNPGMITMIRSATRVPKSIYLEALFFVLRYATKPCHVSLRCANLHYYLRLRYASFRLGMLRYAKHATLR